MFPSDKEWDRNIPLLSDFVPFRPTLAQIFRYFLSKSRPVGQKFLIPVPFCPTGLSGLSADDLAAVSSAWNTLGYRKQAAAYEGMVRSRHKAWQAANVIKLSKCDGPARL